MLLAQVISMTARLLDGGDAGVCGVLTSGGTESIVLATKAHRDFYREVAFRSAIVVTFGFGLACVARTNVFLVDCGPFWRTNTLCFPHGRGRLVCSSLAMPACRLSVTVMLAGRENVLPCKMPWSFCGAFV